MGWSSLNAEQRVRVLLELAGGPRYSAQMKQAAASTALLGKSTTSAGNAMEVAAHKGFIWNQMMYTARRYTFYATAGIAVLGAEVLKLGFSYQSTMLSAQAMLRPIFSSNEALQNVLNNLFLIAAKTPFTFKDTVHAFQLLYSGFRPLGISAQTTLTTITAISNALAFSNRLTPTSFNRVALALQHVAFAGRLTGYAVNQLYRDGVPIFDILNKKLGITGDQMTNIASLGIPAAAVLKAINSYLLTQPGYARAAFKAQISTIPGAFSTLKDFLSQASGNGSSGAYGGILHFLKAVNEQLYPFSNRQKPISLTDFVTAIDKVLSPRTHLVINFFEFLTGIVYAFAISIKVATKAVSLLLWPLTSMFNLFVGRGGGMFVARLAGYAVGLLLFITLVGKAIKAVRILIEVTRAELALEGAALLLGKARGLASTGGLVGMFKNPFRKVLSNPKTIGSYPELIYANRAVRLLATGLLKLRVAFLAAYAASAPFFAALLTNPFFWIAVVIAGLIILYFKWKPFRDIVNSTFDFVRRNAPLVAAALALLLGPIGAIIGGLLLIIKYWNQISSAPHQVAHSAASTIQKSQSRGGFWSAIIDNPAFHIPAFAEGGIVPGPIGAAKIIVAHGGEEITSVADRFRGLAGNGDGRPQQIDIYLGPKRLARIVAKSDADVEARL